MCGKMVTNEQEKTTGNHIKIFFFSQLLKMAIQTNWDVGFFIFLNNQF